MPDLTFIQSIGRKTHTASDGIEIQRQFYFEPYFAFPEVLEALQGSVKKDTGIWVRTLPARDPYITNCFCNEARIDFADGDALASSPDISLGDPELSLLGRIQGQRESPTIGAAGGIVTASYRPLITAVTEVGHHNAFDWLDPQFQVTLREVPWPAGLFIQGDPGPLGRKSVPKELGSPIRIPVIDFTIRRLLVGEPSWSGIELAAGKINDDVFPGNFDPPTNLPSMARGTLRFDGANLLNRLSADGSTWYEIGYNFSWLNYHDSPVFDENGNELQGINPVTWNHVLMRPKHAGLVAFNKMGWYFVQKQALFEFLPFKTPFFTASAGALYTYGNFSHLFKLL